MKAFLFPNEKVIFKSPSEIKYLNDKFDFYITDHRAIVFNKKKKKFFAERFWDIRDIRYKETGLLRRQTSLVLTTVEGYEMEFNGKPSTIGAILKEIQKLDIAKRFGKPLDNMVKCKFCLATVQPDSTVCPECRKILK